MPGSDSGGPKESPTQSQLYHHRLPCLHFSTPSTPRFSTPAPICCRIVPRWSSDPPPSPLCGRSATKPQRLPRSSSWRRGSGRSPPLPFSLEPSLSPSPRSEVSKSVARLTPSGFEPPGSREDMPRLSDPRAWTEASARMQASQGQGRGTRVRGLGSASQG